MDAIVKVLLERIESRLDHIEEKLESFCEEKIVVLREGQAGLDARVKSLDRKFWLVFSTIILAAMASGCLLVFK